MVVKVENPILRKRPFKFFDFWMQHSDFNSIVKQVWENPGYGVPMFRLVRKLKILKGRLKQLNRDSFANISVRTSEARKSLKQTQVGLLNDPTSMVADLERAQRRTLVELRSQEESFFRQKARIRWLKEGDRNTKFFHQYVSKRHLRNRILSVVDSSGNQITEPQLVQQHFVEHFHDFLKPRMELEPLRYRRFGKLSAPS